MKSRKRKPTDDDIEAEVLATRGDSSVWEALPFVPPSASPRPAWLQRNRHLQVAAKFHVLSVLHRLGVEANLALAQPDDVDIAVLGKNGHAITIDVKLLESSREWLVDRFSARRHHYVIFVDLAPSAEPPRAYVVASEQLRRYIARRKLTSLSVDRLRDDLAALEAWQTIMSERAA